MSLREQVVRELNNLSEDELQQVAEYLAFLKFRNRVSSPPMLDETQLAALYGEFGDADRELAEEGLSDYADGLVREDNR